MTDLQLLALFGAHTSITPTLCVDKGLFSNRGAAGRRLRELAEAGYLSALPGEAGHYTPGARTWQMLLGSINGVAARALTLSGLADRLQLELRQVIESLNGAVHGLTNMGFAARLSAGQNNESEECDHDQER